MMKGPKAILAEAISNALADYFVVDQKSMETNLLVDAGIKLHGTNLKPRDGVVLSSTTTASIRGHVQDVAFQWHWGKSEKEGGSDWVKDVRLVLSGLRFTVTLISTKSSPRDSTTETTEKESSHQPIENKTDASSGIMAYVHDQVQRILDTLTLVVNDVLFTVVLPDGSNIQLGGSAMELCSLGVTLSQTENEEKVVVQQLQIHQLFSRITNKDDCTFPVLGEFSYHAKMQRTIKNRFVSGLDTGLLIDGDSDDKGVVLYAGSNQLEVLNTFLGLVVASSDQKSTSSTTEKTTTTDDSSDIHAPNTAIDSASVALSENMTIEVPSFMGLKLSGVSLVLPNETKLALNDLIFNYRFDGTMLQIEGRAGFAVDGFPMVALGETSAWTVDLLHCTVEVKDAALTKEQQNTTDMVLFVNARQEEIHKVSDGLNQVFGIYQRLASMDTGAVSLVSSAAKDTVPVAPVDTKVSTWCLHIVGKLGCVIEREADTEIMLALQNVKANSQTMVLSIDSVDELYIPGMLRLAEPILDMKFQWNGSSLLAILPEVVVVLVNKNETQNESNTCNDKAIEEKSLSTTSKPTAAHSAESTGSRNEGSPGSIALPFGLCLHLHKLLAFKSDGKTVHTTLDTLQFQVDPLYPSGNADTHGPNITMNVTINEINHDMLRMKQPTLSLEVDLASTFETIYNVKFGADEIRVAAGYSLSDWKSWIPKKRQQENATKPWMLPNIHVEKLKVLVLVKGLIGFQDTTLHVPAFEGNAGTTVNDVMLFYNQHIITQVPGMISNAQVLGTNVSDGVVGHFGGGILASTVGSTGVGGIVSVAAFDGVKNTIKAGKVSRGVTETDEWRLSDLLDGLKYTAVRVTREGAAKRGKREDETGDAIDWAVGATSDLATYSNANKARLGGAGAGAVGFACGLALGGPVGAIAGTILASATTQKTIETIEDKLKDGVSTKDPQLQMVIKDINPRQEKETIVYQGLLLKRRDFVVWGWHLHCFTLTTSSELQYYEVSTQDPSSNGKILYMDSSKGPRKALKLDENHRVEIADSVSNPNENLFVFTIHTSQQQQQPLWVLAAPTEELRSIWVARLQETMASRSLQRSPGLERD